MPTVSLSNPLDFTKISSLFLYGEDTVPVIYENRLRPDNAPTIVVDIASSFWTGPGRYAMPVLAPFVSSFFTSLISLPSGVQELYSTRFAAQGNVGPVKITVADLILQAGVPASQFHYSFAQYGFGTNTADYGARTYIYNNEGFSISPSTVFVFDPNGDSYIENLQVKPDLDNFDFVSVGFTQLGNSFELR